MRKLAPDGGWLAEAFGFGDYPGQSGPPHGEESGCSEKYRFRGQGPREANANPRPWLIADGCRRSVVPRIG